MHNVKTQFDIAIQDNDLHGLQRGDRVAQGKIYELFSTPVFTLCVRLLGCRSAAADVTQDIFIQVFAQATSFRGDAPFWAWLRQVAVRCALQSLRKQAMPLFDAAWRDSPVVADVEAPAQLDLHGALAQLDARTRSLVWLVLVEGYTHTEVAAWMDCSVAASKSRLQRGVALLRAHYSEPADPPTHRSAIRGSVA